ncbi:GlsB/YeaQ/YmgE family stress response membrane protein [Halovulum dunhuangense]|uniref:GlsB/YeaQ/YmgE family stress response membrane protein n=1 Tax=Halovulum dunhuangense TaxID=1505036 RepID=A0A849KW14_9RHOB|nr:GlsB/YeaQ/YmgE family stress response membrane protein [Halovulum dunhuangense]NNU79658.1 GlsB/YeaQ/YmgE family stress response membrane protein [Halovulum dunhuangense]
MAIIWLIIIGAAAGFIATRIMDMELGLPQTIAVGVIGAIIGGALLRLVLAALGWGAGLVGAIIGALLLLWGYKVFLEGRR